MKKLLSLTLAIVMILTTLVFSSCGAKTPKEIFDEAMKNMESVTDFAVTASGNITVGVMGMNVEMPLTMDMAIKGIDMKDPASINDAELFLDADVSAMGQTIDMEIYYADGYMYMNTMGETAKAAVTELLPAGFSFEETSEMKSISEKYGAEIEKATTYTKNEDGSVTASCSIPAGLYDDVFAEIRNNPNMASLSIDDMEFAVDTCNITVKDGMLSGYDMGLSCTVETEGETMTMDMDFDIDFTAYGDKVVITPPEGYESYPEA